MGDAGREQFIADGDPPNLLSKAVEGGIHCRHQAANLRTAASSSAKPASLVHVRAGVVGQEIQKFSGMLNPIFQHGI